MNSQQLVETLPGLFKGEAVPKKTLIRELRVLRNERPESNLYRLKGEYAFYSRFRPGSNMKDFKRRITKSGYPSYAWETIR